MAVTINYDKSLNIVLVDVVGQLSVDDVIGTSKKIFADVEIPNDVDALWDIRELDASTIDKEFFEQLVTFRKSNISERGSARLAFVADGDFEFGMARMYEMLSEGLPQHMHIFRDMKSAYSWLQG